MKELIACCGLDCESCDARIATVRNDDQLREETAKKWSILNNTSEITTETINCMGAIRKCVNEKGFNTCGDCKEMDSCQIVAPIFQNAPGSRENLLSSTAI